MFAMNARGESSMPAHYCHEDSDGFFSRIVYSDSEYELLVMILILYSYVLNGMLKQFLCV